MEDLPFISQSDFHNACQELEGRLRNGGVDSKLVVQNEIHCLIIRRSARDHTPDMERTHYSGPPPPSEEEEVELKLWEHADPAALRVPPMHPWTVPVEYHILLSPTYRVPVLYFQALYPLNPRGAQGVSHVLEHLVPAVQRSQVESVGVMGAISQTHHPISNLTYFTIHPCNTADALREILDDRTPSPPEYLQIWLGLVGPTVGLHLPKEVVAIGSGAI